MSLTRKIFGKALVVAAVLATPVDALAAAGLRSPASGQFLERLEIPQQRVVSDRGADFLSPLGLKSSFLSETTPPATGLSVRLWNTTAGFSGETPFSERTYEQNFGADPFVVAPDAKHRTRWFSVLPGSDSAPKQNDFRYEIVDPQGNVLEQGEFSVAIALNPTPVTTTFRYGPDYRNPYYPTDYYYGLGWSRGRGHHARGRYGHYWNERHLFRARQRFLRNNSEIHRRRLNR